MLIPSEVYGDIMKIICGVFVVYTLLAPIKNIFPLRTSGRWFESKITEDEFLFQTQQGYEGFSEALKSETDRAVSDGIGEELRKVWSKDIKTELDGDELTIYNAPREKAEQIKRYVQEHYGLKVVLG